MTHVTSWLTVKNRDQLPNPTLGSRVWATFFTYLHGDRAGASYVPCASCGRRIVGDALRRRARSRSGARTSSSRHATSRKLTQRLRVESCGIAGTRRGLYVLAAGDDGADVRKRVAVTQVGAGHVGSREVADDEYQPARRLGPEVHLQRTTAATANHRPSTKIQLITPPPTGEWSIVMVVSVCVCVCLSAIISSDPHVGSSPHFCACYL